MYGSFRSRLSRAALSLALSTSTFAMPAMADDATYSVKDYATRALEASALSVQGDGVLKTLVNDSLLVGRQAYAMELWFMGQSFTASRATYDGKGGYVLLGVVPPLGEPHAVSGRYQLGVPEGPGTAFASFLEDITSPPGFTGGMRSFDIKEGWVDVQFSPDRTHVDMTFEFVAFDDELGTRVVKSGSFSGPNYDLPPQDVRTP
ncbi:hypothetical protein [Luteibacter sp. 329MFSha]|uniref:hypothetical protein n=1 Tax=Luteibacter sp. 329MFSha TaxID=1798239 RepID=UPI0008B4E6F4|nr:hypothetical protein [Luteibacter sp. 329MFSha]SEW25753.1 hypothetical protein SAMN04515660_3435 [Luteibacter sp. 329MFSha]